MTDNKKSYSVLLNIKKIRACIVKFIPKSVRALILKIRYRMIRSKCKLNSHQILFESYHGDEYACNPKAIYEAILSAPEYKGFEFVWAFNEPDRFLFLDTNPRTRVVKKGSRKYYIAAAESKYLINNMGFPLCIEPQKNQVYINTWHGKPIKKIGCDIGSFDGFETGAGKNRRKNLHNYTETAKRQTILFSGANVWNDIMISAYNLKAVGRESTVRAMGYPRNSALFRVNSAWIESVKTRLGIPFDKKVILYAPTWRSYKYSKTLGYEIDIPFEPYKLAEQLGDDYVILLRGHNLVAKSFRDEKYNGSIINVTDEKDINDLYIISDLMISDYSGAIFDYALLRKPIILFVYDREEYENNSIGVYFNIDEFPFRKVYDKNDLAAAIKSELIDFKYSEEYRAFNSLYNEMESEHTALDVVQSLINPD